MNSIMFKSRSRVLYGAVCFFHLFILFCRTNWLIIQCRAGSVEPIGGVARFQSVVNYYRNLDRPSDEEKDNDKTNGVKSVDLITLFSGDVFNPSLESSVTKGQHMVPVLNRIGVDATCVGVSKPTCSLPISISISYVPSSYCVSSILMIRI